MKNKYYYKRKKHKWFILLIISTITFMICSTNDFSTNDPNGKMETTVALLLDIDREKNDDGHVYYYGKFELDDGTTKKVSLAMDEKPEERVGEYITLYRLEGKRGWSISEIRAQRSEDIGGIIQVIVGCTGGFLAFMSLVNLNNINKDMNKPIETWGD